MAEGLLLEPTPDIVHCVTAELDDVKGADDRDGVLEPVVDRVLVPVERSNVAIFTWARNASPRSRSQSP